MCDQRERLIDYLYDEGNAADHAAMHAHVESCADCRAEIASLRAVQTDLQAWEVPDHESVWRPFAPSPTPAWWLQVPRWALAAAAGVVLASGAAGGAVAHVLRPQPVVAAPQAPVGVSSINAMDLAALEQRLEARIREEVDALNTRVQLASSRPMPAEMAAVLHAAFDQQLSELREKSDRQLDLISQIYASQGQYQKGFSTRQAILTSRVENLARVLEQGR